MNLELAWAPNPRPTRRDTPVMRNSELASAAIIQRIQQRSDNPPELAHRPWPGQEPGKLRVIVHKRITEAAGQDDAGGDLVSDHHAGPGEFPVRDNHASFAALGTSVQPRRKGPASPILVTTLPGQRAEASAAAIVSSATWRCSSLV